MLKELFLNIGFRNDLLKKRIDLLIFTFFDNVCMSVHNQKLLLIIPFLILLKVKTEAGVASK